MLSAPALITMENSQQALDWICRMKSSAKPPAAASTPADTPTKSGNQADWTVDDFKFALDLAKQALDIAEVAPSVKLAAALLLKIMESYQELKDADEKCLARHIANLTGNISIDKLNQELEFFDARITTNRLVGLCLDQTPNTQTQDKVHDMVYDPHSAIQAPITIYGGTGGPGGPGAATGGAGGTGGGTTVNFTSMNQEPQNVEIAVRRLLLQLSAQSPEPYKTLDHQYNLSAGQNLPTYEELCHWLLDLLHEVGWTYVVLDALDECNTSDFNKLVDFVSDLKAKAKGVVHLFITSQPRDVFTEGFTDVNHIVLHRYIMEQDIKLFVTKELQVNSELDAWLPIKDQVTKRITQKSQGMFRLAACLLKALTNYSRGEDEDLSEILEKLPDTLTGMYDQFIQAIKPKDWLHVKAALQWIMYHKGQNLTLDMLADAIAFDFSNPVQYSYKPHWHKSNMTIIRKQLVKLIQIEDHSVTLAHASVQDYLLSDHFRKGSLLITVCCFGKSDVVQLLLDKGADVNLGGGQYGSPLAAASCHGKLDIVQLLLDKGADVNLAGGKYGSPLAAASYCGKLEIVQLLLDNDADVNLGGGEYGSPLGAASYQGKLDIVQLLLDKGADVNLGGQEYGSPLGAAFYSGEWDIVQLLLDQGADVNLTGGEYGSPLAAAAYYGKFEIVSLLLNKSADANLAGGKYGSPLAAASYGGELDIVQLLLDKGADVNLGGGKYGSPLATASYRGNLEIVQLLLNKGADANLAGGKYHPSRAGDDTDGLLTA
ncbi:Ankyrin repeat protein [Mycena sanguinolenta]|uniref:Ankyrin repeat protein n=1 Tax=Mycena sanguinolenta TaxID=230812 RepID=A0A8H6Y039_9AGAR|nr:Ankyrin repeat protein [Mycena sanguinolenta]